MKKTKFILRGVITTLVLGVAALSLGSNNNFFRALGTDPSKVWKHYAAVPSDEVDYGTKEYWVSCGTNNHVLDVSDLPGDAVVEEGANYDASVFAADDDRWNKTLKAYNFTQNLVGTAMYNITTGNDYTWGLQKDVSMFKFKAYDANTFRWTFPRINFNHYTRVTADVTLNAFGQVRLAFEQADLATAHEFNGESHGGGTFTFIRDTSKLVATIAVGGQTYVKNITAPNVIAGQASLEMYAQGLSGDNLLTFDNFTPDTHVHNYSAWTTNNLLGGEITRTCAVCGHVEKDVSTAVDFTRGDVHGAEEHIVSDPASEQTWILSSGATTRTTTSFQFKTFETNHTFKLGLPKIKYSSFTKVVMRVDANNWDENIFFGWTQADAEAHTYHTTYGGDKENGSIVVELVEGVYQATLTLEYMTITTDVTDADVLAGTKSLAFYQTSLHDRLMTISNLQFTKVV